VRDMAHCQLSPVERARERPALELDTGGLKRGAERRGQKGPSEEALAPEGQSRRNERTSLLSTEVRRPVRWRSVKQPIDKAI
jgi:hypothetical protein